MSKVNTLLNYFSSPKGSSAKIKDSGSPGQRSKPLARSQSVTPKREQKKIDTTKLVKSNGKANGKAQRRLTASGKENGEKFKERKRSLEDSYNNGEDDDDHHDHHDGDNYDEDIENKGNVNAREAATPKPSSKRRRIIVPKDSSDDSEDDYKPEESESSPDDQSFSADEEVLSEETEELDEEESPKKKRKVSGKEKPVSKVIGRKKSAWKNEKNDSLTSNQEQPAPKASDTKSWPHLKYDFLQPGKIKDVMRRPADHPDYDPRTVHVPTDFLSSQTPAMNQWWRLKANHFDCVLFFKVGKFYELYHMDAVIGVKELSLSFMRGEFAHSGFPEIAYGRFSASLIERGYKVARIEQTENPEMMGQRCAKMPRPTKFDRVVNREICQISSKGTRVYTSQDGEPSVPTSSYLLAIVEKYDVLGKATAYGICFIDTSIGVFNLGQFHDDPYNSRLLTLLAHYPPAHVIYERGNLSQQTLNLLNNQLPSAMKDAFQKGTQFWSSSKLLKTLHEDEYFKSERDGDFSWPKGLRPFLNPGDSLGLTACEEKELAVTALGGCVYLLKEYQLDHQLLSQGRFKAYLTPDFGAETPESSRSNAPHNMVLDAMTINNLRVLGEDGSLIKTLDHCCTAFGKRLLQEWTCRPSCRKSVIIERQEAVTELLDNPGVVQDIRGRLSHLPDLERLLSKIHSQGNSAKSLDHPDRRAIMFEGQTYSKRTIVQFITALKGFEDAIDIIDLFKDFVNPLIVKCTKLEPEGNLTELRRVLDGFKMSFDHEEAKKEGFIVPKEGVDSDYDAVLLELASIKKDLQDYLVKEKRHFGVSVQFCGSGRKKYQIEVPESQVKKVGANYELQGSRKGYKKYYTAEARELLAREIAAEEHKDRVLRNSNGKIFGKFSELYDVWSRVTYNVAVLDCLMSFFVYSRGCETCVPTIYDDDDVDADEDADADANSEKILIEIVEGKHPCIVTENFIANDTAIAGPEAAPLMILTGPNMGGKSTVMRQVGLITILAQMGCHVPASACRLTLVDRIFTRIGANDDIMAGQSTFLVELSETAAILQHATKRSLVLLDELGRGTSTYDGTAIAASVVQALTKMKCRTIFSTHYHSLVEDYKTNKNVSLAHMACMVENEEENEENEEEEEDGDKKISQENVTFLYKLSKGACPKSYGFNAARLAGIPANIVKRAHDIATKLETEVNLRHAFVSLCTLKDTTSTSSLMPILKKIPF